MKVCSLLKYEAFGIIYVLTDYLIPQQMKNDRAAQRRKEIGSSGINEKTMTASVDT